MLTFTGRKLPYWTKVENKPNWWPEHVAYRNVNWGVNKPRIDELVQIMDSFNQHFDHNSDDSVDIGGRDNNDGEEGETNSEGNECGMNESHIGDTPHHDRDGDNDTVRREDGDDEDEGDISENEAEEIKRQVMVCMNRLPYTMWAINTTSQ